MEKRKHSEERSWLTRALRCVGFGLAFYALLLALSALLTVRALLPTDAMERSVLVCAAIAAYAGVRCGMGKERSVAFGGGMGAVLFVLCAVLGVLVYPDVSFQASAWPLGLSMLLGGALAGWKHSGRKARRRRPTVGRAR